MPVTHSAIWVKELYILKKKSLDKGWVHKTEGICYKFDQCGL